MSELLTSREPRTTKRGPKENCFSDDVNSMSKEMKLLRTQPGAWETRDDLRDVALIHCCEQCGESVVTTEEAVEAMQREAKLSTITAATNLSQFVSHVNFRIRIICGNRHHLANWGLLGLQ